MKLQKSLKILEIPEIRSNPENTPEIAVLEIPEIPSQNPLEIPNVILEIPKRPGVPDASHNG